MRTPIRSLRFLSHRGLAAVEMALVAPVLAYMMLSVVELGMMFSSYMQVRTVAREGAREASVGRAPAEIDARTAAVAVSLDSTLLTTIKEYRPSLGDSSYGSWITLGADTVGRNTAPMGAHVRVTATYAHHLSLPGMFRALADPGSTTGTRTIRASVVMRRE